MSVELAPSPNLGPKQVFPKVSVWTQKSGCVSYDPPFMVVNLPRTLTWFPCFSFTRLSKHFRKWGCTASRLQSWSLQCNTSLYAETLTISIGVSSCHIRKIFTICFSHLPNFLEISSKPSSGSSCQNCGLSVGTYISTVSTFAVL